MSGVRGEDDDGIIIKMASCAAKDEDVNKTKNDIDDIRGGREANYSTVAMGDDIDDVGNHHRDDDDEDDDDDDNDDGGGDEKDVLPMGLASGRGRTTRRTRMPPLADDMPSSCRKSYRPYYYRPEPSSWTSHFFFHNIAPFFDMTRRRWYRVVSRMLTNDNRGRVCAMSFAIVLFPCLSHLTSSIIGHLATTTTTSTTTTMDAYPHVKLANDIGKFGSSCMIFLLFPISRLGDDPLFASLGLSGLHVYRMHVYAGWAAFLGSLVHGAYHVLIWTFDLDGVGVNGVGDSRWDAIFPFGDDGVHCWAGAFASSSSSSSSSSSHAHDRRRMHDVAGEGEGGDSSCYHRFVNLLGVLSMIAFVVLVLTSLWNVRRTNYAFFRVCHVICSIIMLFGLVMHYNKMIWYVSPGLLHYLGTNVPTFVEGWYKWNIIAGGRGEYDGEGMVGGGTRGAMGTRRISGDGGMDGDVVGFDDRDDDDDDDDNNDDDDDDVDGDGLDRDDETTMRPSKVVCIPDSGGCVELTFRTASRHRPVEYTHRMRHADAVGKYVQLYVPEISRLHGHPFTMFTYPKRDGYRRDDRTWGCGDAFHVLYRTRDNFTRELSRRLDSLVASSDATRRRVRRRPPKMLINGIRGGTTREMFENATSAHDGVVIIAGGVGIVSYISLLHAVREHSISRMGTMEGANLSNRRNGEDTETMDEIVNDNASMIIKNHLQLTHKDGDDEYYDDCEYNGGGKGGGEGGRVINPRLNSGDAAASALADASYSSINPTSKKNAHRTIDVHWISRDEGLIRHVLANYLEPFCYATNDGEGGLESKSARHSGGLRSASTASIACPISINIIVHHTSPLNSLAKLLASADVDAAAVDALYDDTNSAVLSQGSTRIWKSRDEHRYRGERRRTAAMSVASIYDGNHQSLIHNIIPAGTYATIVFGGMCIVQYCYANIQNKNVVHTRMIAVFGIVALSLVVALISYGLVLVSEACYAKFNVNGNGLHQSSIEDKCEGLGVEMAEFGRGAPKIFSREEKQPQLVVDDCEGDSELNNVRSSTDQNSLPAREENDLRIITISHSQGRPDLADIVGDAMRGGKTQRYENGGGYDCDDEHRNAEFDLGIFMCGPTEMTDSVRRAIQRGEEEKRMMSCGAAISAAVYQEVFEL